MAETEKTDKEISGGSAFPVPERMSEGMTLRDYFAGQALAGILANPHAWEEWGIKEATASAYKHADAMIEQRKT